MTLRGARRSFCGFFHPAQEERALVVVADPRLGELDVDVEDVLQRGVVVAVGNIVKALHAFRRGETFVALASSIALLSQK